MLRAEASKCALTFDKSFVESTAWAFAADHPEMTISNVTEGSKAFVNAHVLKGNKLCKEVRAIVDALKFKTSFGAITEQSIVKKLQEICHVTSKEIHYPTNPELESGIYAGAGNLAIRAAIGVLFAASQKVCMKIAKSHQEKHDGDAIQLLNDKDKVPCTIQNGKLL